MCCVFIIINGYLKRDLVEIYFKWFAYRITVQFAYTLQHCCTPRRTVRNCVKKKMFKHETSTGPVCRNERHPHSTCIPKGKSVAMENPFRPCSIFLRAYQGRRKKPYIE